MQPIRSPAASRILTSRRKAIFAKWETAVGQSMSCDHIGRIREPDKSSRKSQPWVLEGTKGPTPIGPVLCRFLGETCHTRSSRTSMLSSTRFFSSARRKSFRNPQMPNDRVDDDEIESILLLLQDTDACPIGSMSPARIKAAEDALEYWVSASATIPRRRKRRHSDYNDKYGEEYRKCFENAKLICSRLAVEQKFDDDEHVSTESDAMGNVGRRYSDQLEQTNEDDENFSDDFYIVRPFLLNRVVDCWRIGWRDGRLDVTPNEMIAWIEEMDSSRNRSMISDNRTLTMIVDGICLRGDPYEGPLLAQWLLDRRLGQAYEDEDDTNLRPDTIFFTNVIRSWAKSGRVEAPEMADGLLQMMHELYNSGWIESAPNAYSYAATMEAWSKSHQNPDSIKRIEALLEEMKNSSLVQVVPDRVSYQYLLNAFANSKSAAGAEKAYDVLQEMIALYEAGNVLVTPNASNFSRVILALAQNGKSKYVESVMEQLQALYSKTGDPNFQPTDDYWKACIIAKAKTGGAAEAQGLLEELVDSAISKGSKNHMLRRSYFIDTLVAWTKIKDRVMAAEMSQKVLDLMIDLAQRDHSYRNLRPDAKAYDKVILAISRSRHHSAPERIDRLLREMKRQCDFGDDKMKPSLAGYTNLMLAWQRSGRNESTDEIQQIFDSLKIECTTVGKKHLRPDRYVFGILIDSWARKDLEKVDFIFEEMMKEWRSGKRETRPDTEIFHKMLRAHSEGNQNHGDSFKKCEYYFSLMKEVGLPTTIPAYSYLIGALSSRSSAEAKNFTKASALLDELLESVRKGNTLFPPKFREYRHFLQTISNSSISHRNLQAKRALKSLSRTTRSIPKELLTP